MLLEAFLWADFYCPSNFCRQGKDHECQRPFGQERGGSRVAGGWHEPPAPQQKSWRVKHGSYIFIRAPKACSFLLGAQPCLRARSQQPHHPSLSVLGRWRWTGALWPAKCRLSTLTSKPQRCLLVSLNFNFCQNLDFLLFSWRKC